MVEVITDTYEFSISIIQHGDLAITNTNIPTNVEAGTPFTIEYEVTNNGATDNCYGHITNTGTETILAGSEWTESIEAGAVVTKTFELSGGITAPFNGVIEVGYTN